MSEAVGKYDITILQGSDKNIKLTFKDNDGELINLSGYTARMQVRSSKKSELVLDDLTTENTRIEISGAEGEVLLKFPASVSTYYNFILGVYDLELVSGQVRRVLEGDFRVNKEVTK